MNMQYIDVFMKTQHLNLLNTKMNLDPNKVLITSTTTS